MGWLWKWVGVAWVIVLSLWVHRAFETGHPVAASLLIVPIVPLVLLSILAVLDT